MHKKLSFSPTFLALTTSATLLLSTQALATETPIINMDEVVISATRTPLARSKSGSSITVIDREKIEKSTHKTLSGILNSVPGVRVTQSGGIGSQSRIFMRGLASQYVKIQVDGVDISDPTAPQAAAILEHILLDDIDRIEVVRGSQSTLYGADAVGGLIQIFTRKPQKDGTSFTASGEVGSHKTVQGNLSGEAKYGQTSLRLTTQVLRTDGISSADQAAGNNEKDGYQNRTVSAYLSHKLNDALEIFGAARYTHASADFDDGTPKDSLLNTTRSEQTSLNFGAHFNPNNKFRNTLTLESFNTTRDTTLEFLGTPYQYWYDGSRISARYQSEYDISPIITLVAGGSFEKTQMDLDSLKGADTDLTSGFIQAIMTPLEALTVTLGGRIDHHSDFGTFETFKATASYNFDATNTVLRASIGTGYRAPSLYELNDSFFGNKMLEPEKSLSWDLGFEQEIGGISTVSVNYFSLNLEDRIAFLYPSGYYNAPGTFHSHGIEAAFAADLTDWLTVDGQYTFTLAQDAGSLRAIRIPRHQYSLGANIVWPQLPELTTRLELEGYNNTIDISSFKLDDVILVNARIDYQLNETLSVYVRGTNLLDEHYQPLKGYGAEGMAVYAGFKARL